MLCLVEGELPGEEKGEYLFTLGLRLTLINFLNTCWLPGKTEEVLCYAHQVLPCGGVVD